jgi:uncharacterized protein DUF4382
MFHTAQAFTSKGDISDMPSRKHGRFFPVAFLALTVASFLLLAGCNSNSTATGPAFVVGTDAPMASVASFSAQIESAVLTDASGNTASLINGTPTVDFARYNGLQALLDMNDVPAGTYTSVTITLGPATLGYLNTGTTPPTIATYSTTSTTNPLTLTSSTVTLPLDKPLVVTTGGVPVGLRMDFDLQKSIGVDGSGNITGTVTPTFHVNTVANTDSAAHIDELIAAVVTPPAAATEPQSFVVQGPHGEQFTINTTATTEWDGTSSLGALTTSSIVVVAGQLDRADQTLDADEVAIISQTGFYAAGLVTYVTPSTGPATSFDLYVRGLLPDNTAVQLGNIAQVNLTGNEDYSIYWMHNKLAQFLFNQSGLLAGQEVAVGGPASGAANASAVTVNHVMLRNWGYIGTVVPGSENPGNGTFQIQVNGFAGVVAPNPVTVYVAGKTDYRYGCGAFSNLTDNAPVRVVGVLLTVNGQPVLVARHVDFFDFTELN